MRAAALPASPRLGAVARWMPRLDSALVALALAMAALLAVVPPLGEFPINDDWLYARTGQGLIERGQLMVPAWAACSLLLQAYWGGLFARLFGFSHGALRASTVVLGAAGVLGCYALLRELLDPGRALLGALLLLVNPLYVTLSYSFMSDVPFLALTFWALFCYTRALRGTRPSSAWLAAGSALARGASLVRPAGVALARLAESLSTLGLFTLPLAVGLLAAPGGLRPGRRQRWLAGALLLMFGVGLFAHVAIFDRGWLLPYAKDVLSARGFLGRDHLNGTLPESVVIPDGALAVATVVAILSGGLLALATAALPRETL